MVDAIASQDFKFEILTATGPDVYTEVIGVNGFDGLDGKASEIDATHLGSTAKEFMMGLPDNGNWNLSVNYLSADPGQVAMRAAKASRAVKSFRCTFSDDSTAEFDGYVTTSPLSGSVDAKVDTSFAIRITGEVVFG